MRVVHLLAGVYLYLYDFYAVAGGPSDHCLLWRKCGLFGKHVTDTGAECQQEIVHWSIFSGLPTASFV